MENLRIKVRKNFQVPKETQLERVYSGISEVILKPETLMSKLSAIREEATKVLNRYKLADGPDEA